jgi:hypothetical protein
MVGGSENKSRPLGCASWNPSFVKAAILFVKYIFN